MLELTTADFDEKTARGLTVVDFWAPWCGPCKMFAPIYEATARERPDIRFAKVNVDEHQELSMRYNIRGIPTMVFLRDGQEIGRQSGAMGKPQFEQTLDRIFKS